MRPTPKSVTRPALIAACMLVIACGLATAQQSLESQIFQALSPTGPTPGLTRSITNPPPQAVEERRFIEQLRTRAISVEPGQPVSAGERAQIVAITKDKPKIDLEIYFDFNSAVVRPKALPALIALGNVLS
jgi:hypothetical protein